MRHHGQDRDRLTVVGFDEISWLRGNSPAWRLLRAENAPLVLSFLDQVFVAENIRSIAAAELANRLDDELYALNERLDERAFPKPAKAYLVADALGPSVRLEQERVSFAAIHQATLDS